MDANTVQSQGLPAGFQLDQPAQANPNMPDQANPDGLPQGFQLDEEKYGSPKEQLKAGLEGAGRGLIGAGAPYLEKKLGVKPQDIIGREEQNPVTSTVGELGAFGAGLVTDLGLPSLLGKAGEAAAHVTGLAQPVTTASKLAKGAVQAATEMGLYQGNDEASKAILDVPNAPGTIAANIGLSALLGGATGGALTGTGLLAKSLLDQPVLKDFVDQLARRKANPEPQEMLMHEFDNAYKTYHDMWSEVGGSTGLKAQALQKMMPEMSQDIIDHSQEINNKVQAALQDLTETEDPHARLLARELKKYQGVVSQPSITPFEMFDAAQNLKGQLQEWGKFNKDMVPLSEKQFRNTAKSLAYDIRTSLENPKIWGKDITDIQKGMNSAWKDAIPAVKDAESKFMTKVGGELVIDPAKFNTYLNQNGKTTNQTIRQQMMGKFVNAMEKFTNAVNKTYEKAGVENPFPAVGLSSLKESLDKVTTGAKLANIWHDRLESSTLGHLAGAGVGEAIAPGIGGAYIGKEVLGPVFGNMIKPLMDKYPNVDLNAAHKTMQMFKNIVRGDSLISKATDNIFKAGTRVLPTKFLPDNDKLEKLDKKVQGLNSNPAAAINHFDGINQYASDHGGAIGKTISDVVTYLNQQRPNPTSSFPLDKAPKALPMETAAYARTLTIAEQPLSVLQLVKDGRLLPKDVVDLKSLYPELYGKMSQQLMNSMINQMHDGEAIPYHTKMGLSLFLGAPLEASMSPASIIAAQPVPKAPPQIPQGKPKRGSPSKLGNKTVGLYKTPGQEAEQDKSDRS